MDVLVLRGDSVIQGKKGPCLFANEVPKELEGGSGKSSQGGMLA